ncbi:MAG: hypothetical protein ACTSX7_15540 [Alphaproteobacteria bacterium]
MADDDALGNLADRIQARAVRQCGELMKRNGGGVNLDHSHKMPTTPMLEDPRQAQDDTNPERQASRQGKYQGAEGAEVIRVTVEMGVRLTFGALSGTLKPIEIK